MIHMGNHMIPKLCFNFSASFIEIFCPSNVLSQLFLNCFLRAQTRKLGDYTLCYELLPVGLTCLW